MLVGISALHHSRCIRPTFTLSSPPFKQNEPIQDPCSARSRPREGPGSLAKAQASLDLAAAKAAVKEAVVVKAAKKATAPVRAPTVGQQRWRSFQKFIWQQMKAVSAVVSYKEAMKEAGRRWEAGQPKLPADAAAFDAWLGSRSSDSEEDPASDDGASVSSGGGGGGASPIPGPRATGTPSPSHRSCHPRSRDCWTSKHASMQLVRQQPQRPQPPPTTGARTPCCPASSTNTQSLPTRLVTYLLRATACLVTITGQPRSARENSAAEARGFLDALRGLPVRPSTLHELLEKQALRVADAKFALTEHAGSAWAKTDGPVRLREAGAAPHRLRAAARA